MRDAWELGGVDVEVRLSLDDGSSTKGASPRMNLQAPELRSGTVFANAGMVLKMGGQNPSSALSMLSLNSSL